MFREEHIVKQSGNNTYFQFGRKDPMPGAVDGSSSPTSKPCYALADYQFKTIKKKVPIAVGIKNPHVFYQDIASSAWNNTNWTLENETDLWGCSTSSNTAIDASVRKTIYDPSPSGFCLPASRSLLGNYN
ncbi:hypothetical protein NXV26_09805 [Bacteroides fragilis]|nr:hypothetical protein [Bacteroides fragilis]